MGARDVWGGGSGAHVEGKYPRAASEGNLLRRTAREAAEHGQAISPLPAGGQGPREARPHPTW